MLARCLIFHLLLLFATFTHSEQFVMGYTLSSQKAAMPLILERVECVFEMAGHEAVFRELPAARLDEMLQQGKLDGDIARVSEIVTENSIAIPTPISEIGVWVFGRPRLNITTKDDLKRYKMVPVHGIVYFDRYPADDFSRVARARSLNHALKMVQGGRGDYTFGTDESVREIEKQGWQKKLVRYPETPIEILRLYMIMHSRHAEHIAGLDQALKKMNMGEQCDSDT